MRYEVQSMQASKVRTASDGGSLDYQELSRMVKLSLYIVKLLLVADAAYIKLVPAEVAEECFFEEPLSGERR